jgi:hypothetical protein
MKYSIKTVCLSVVLVIGWAALPAEAHHSIAAVDMDKTLTATGVVSSFEWTNPHAWIWVAVKDDKTGATQKLGFECAALTMLRRSGWQRDSLKAGDKVVVQYHPLKTGDAGGMFMGLQFEDGRKLGMVGGGGAPSPGSGPGPVSGPGAGAGPRPQE